MLNFLWILNFCNKIRLYFRDIGKTCSVSKGKAPKGQRLNERLFSKANETEIILLTEIDVLQIR
jgi:hypothetical protein